MTKCVHIGGTIFPNDIVDLAATKADEKIEKIYDNRPIRSKMALL